MDSVWIRYEIARSFPYKHSFMYDKSQVPYH